MSANAVQLVNPFGFDTLAELSHVAGAGRDITSYLEARGIRTIAALALIANDDAGLEKNLLAPLLNGWKSGQNEIVIPDLEQPLAKAILTHMWTEANLWWQHRQRRLTLATSTPSATAPSGNASTSAASASDDRPPRTLPLGIWAAQIKRYNEVEVGGRTRQFPERELIGAEATLARLWHEHTKSKQYCPVPLGDILSKRHFQSTGEINPLAKQERKVMAVTMDNDKLMAAEDSKVAWEPRSVLAMLDGVNSIRWAYVLLEIGEEADVHQWADWRSHGNYVSASDEGKPLTSAIAEVMSDVDLFHDYMSRDLVKKENPNTPQKRKWSDAQAVVIGNGLRLGMVSSLGGALATRGGVTIRDSTGPLTSGDFLNDSAPDVAQLIRRHDADATCLIICAAGPPCPDFSTIHNGPGRGGPEGTKFVDFTQFTQDLETELSDHKFAYIVENVIMADHQDADFFSRALWASPVIVDGADLGIINRPRLWWTRINWGCSGLRNPFNGKPLKWTKQGRYHRLLLDVPFSEADRLDLGSLRLSRKVRAREARVPCLTTPAPDDQGRPPPKKMRGKVPPDVHARWMADQRQYAPWQYAECAMLHDSEDQLHPMTAEAKEQLHGFAAGFTKVGCVPAKSRHKMMANSWHLTVGLQDLEEDLNTGFALVDACIPAPAGNRELIADRAHGKVTGPYLAPSWWPVASVSPDGSPLLKLPSDDVAAACCFAVVQADKVRRCEDFRRSFHNSTVNVSDVPHHHTIDAYVSLLQYLFTQGHKDLRIWGEDMDAAYRLLVIANLHFVDDFGSGEPARWAEKEKMIHEIDRELIADRAHGKVTGPYLAPSWWPVASVLLVIANLHFVDDFGSGEPARWAEKEKMIHEIDRVLCANSLFPDHAQRIAGKLAFLTTTLFGAVGGAALQPLYARGHGLGGGDNERLTEALRAALVCLRHVLRSHRPRFVPWAASLQGPVAVMYTDAFFQMGEKKFKVGSLDIPTGWRPAEAPSYCNGWGFVLRIGEKVYYSCGTIPSYLLEAYCQRRAFIYFLEIAAVLIAAFNMRSVLPQFWVSFIDNHAGKFALQKGYGRDVCINNLLSFFWAVVHEMDPEYAVVVAPGEALTLLEATIHAERCGVDLLGQILEKAGGKRRCREALTVRMDIER
ncbi:unnamed protein product [Effrenium voratum]|nr:unnamed protein product [Effrenium voratum]